MNQPESPSTLERKFPALNFARAFSALSVRAYRWIWTGSFISNIGTWVQKVAQPWLILQLSASPFLLGLDGFLQDVPLLLFLLVGGVAVDRFDKRKILMLSQVVQLSAAVAIAVLIWLDEIRVGIILTLSFVVGTMQAFSTPAYLAFIPSLVGRERLANAVALNSMQFNLSRLIGPAIGGTLIASLGVAWCFGLNGLSFVAMLVALALVPSPSASEAKASSGSVGAQIREGLTAVFARKDLTAIITIVFGISFFGAPLLSFVAVLAKDALNVGAQGFSFALSAFGLGAVAGALAVSSLPSHWIRPKIVVATSSLLGVFIALVALSNLYALTLSLLFLAGLTFVSSNVIGNTILQTTVSDELRGRAVSIYALAFRGGAPIGSLLTGAMVEKFGVQVALALNGVGLLAVAWVARRRLYRR
ncbi:MAG: MFS transporter [Chloroherpetonaceae bacterium]|nr:MFS transporter [Chloroherpetonaceae bacterium]MDW8436777.1 MFS transporter [Chloroherpetonaceae bacterium]